LPRSQATPYITDITRGGGDLVKQNDIVSEESQAVKSGNSVGEIKEGKKPFVEPAISVPVDVLEATTFFEQATSGATN
jgi:hypothetical protein